MPIIVISYRRQDSNDIARRIYEQLKANYGEKSVYIDIESIQPSADYRVHIRQTLERALVMLAVIGTQWAGVRADGSVRIFEPDDPVRDEVETVLANRRAVMPVLVNGARMPTETEVLLAELLCERIPGFDQVRFCNSGTEAVMLGLRQGLIML